jgi:DNA (cytosine-5)-methyltransferase 1
MGWQQVKTAVSLFAGVGGFDLAFERAGAKVVASVEIDKKCQGVLAKHFPQSKIFGDIQGVTGEQLISAGFAPATGFIAGGFPCQDLSVAGKQEGLSGARSGLFWEICRILNETKAQGFVLENVGGLLSSNEGRDMRTVTNALNELGYGLAWRSFDSQHFGVAQRRKRVFIVGFLGDSGERAAEVLAIEEGRRRYLGTGGKEEPRIAVGTPKRTVNDLIHTFSKARRAQSVEDYETWVERDYTNTLNAFDNATEVRATELVISQGRVRRLMPIEMERLQGFPDNWTDGQADSNRYKQMGNAVTVPVAQWIAERMLVNA